MNRHVLSLVITVVLVTGTVTVQAQSMPASSSTASYQTTHTTVASVKNHDVLKPGDRNCIRDTGSLIPPKPGHCLAVPGRSYSRQDLQNTGQIDNSQALRMLDPDVTGGH